MGTYEVVGVHDAILDGVLALEVEDEELSLPLSAHALLPRSALPLPRLLRLRTHSESPANHYYPLPICKAVLQYH